MKFLIFSLLLVSTSISFAAVESRKTDSFGAINCEDEMARLDNFAIELQNAPDAQGYILLYGGRRDTKRDEIQIRGARMKSYLVTRRIDSGRIQLLDGGHQENFTIELWLVPRGASAPAATPTVDERDVRFKRGRMARFQDMECFPGPYHVPKARPGSFGDLAKIPKLGEIRGFTSFSESHLAVWYSNARKGHSDSYEAFLVIYDIRDREPAEVFRIDSSPQRLIPLDALNLPGLSIQSSFADNDAALVIALVDGEFQVVFRGGTSEILDLNGDGVPEVFESMWPDGDGYPKATTIHVWSGKNYRALMKTSWRNRFGPGVLSSVERASRRITRARRA